MRRCLILIVILAGCSREDGERLARVGRLAGGKMRDAAPARTPLGDLNPEATPAGRVRGRLRTDAALSEQSIQVVDAPDGLHLRGKVATEDQIEWAGKLASETVGVGTVVNELVVGP